MKAMNILLGVLVVLMALGGMAMAWDADSQVTAQVTQGIEVSAISPTITLNVGPNDVAVPGAVQVDTNSGSWYLNAIGSNSGYFKSTTSGYNLGYSANPLSVSVDTSPNQYVGSSGHVSMSSLQRLATGVAAGSFPVKVNFDQKVGGAEPAENYQITITYTGSL